MRTTLSIDDELLEAAKVRARERNLTLGRFFEVAVRRELASDDATADRPEVPVFRGGGGVRPGIDLTSNAALAEVLDETLKLDDRR